MHTRLFQYHEIEAGDVLESIKVSFLKVLGKLSYLLEQIVDTLLFERLGSVCILYFCSARMHLIDQK